MYSFGKHWYKYNPQYNACILAYAGSYSCSMTKLLGYFIFEIDNLSTGERMLSERVDHGATSVKVGALFKEMQAQYIGSTTPTR